MPTAKPREPNQWSVQALSRIASFRHLFAGYRTKFVKEIVAPAELPSTYTAYKAQQRRWTQGWVQVQRMHLATLLFRFRCSWLRRIRPESTEVRFIEALLENAWDFRAWG